MATISAATLLSSCEGPRIEFRLINHSETNMEKVDVAWAGTAFSAGYLSRGMEAGLGGLPGPVPEEILLTWVDNGNSHSESIVVEMAKAGSVRGRSSICLVFSNSHWRQVHDLP